MFKASLKLSTLREIVSVSNSIVKDFKATFSTDGIDLLCVDTAHVAIIHLKYDSKIFADFKGDSSELCFNADDLSKTISLGKPDDTVLLSFDPTENRLVIKIGNITREMTLVSPDSLAEVKDVKVNLPSYVIVKLNEIMPGIKAGSIIASDQIEISLDPATGMNIRSENKSNTFNVALNKDKLEKIDIKESVKSLYPLNLLSDFINSLRDVEQLTIYSGTSMPLRIHFDLSKGIGSGKFLLAPRTKGPD